MDKKRKSFLGTKITFTFIRITLIVTILFSLTNIFVLLKIAATGRLSMAAQIGFMIFQFTFVGLVLIFVIALSFLLHRGFGALPRMERMMDKIISGDYSLRIHLRKKDILYPFIEKLNKVLDLLEKK